jgi:transmembrane sensor
MRIEDVMQAARDREVPWDELRERRVLARVRAGIERGDAKGSSFAMWLAAASVALAASAVAIVVLWPREPAAPVGETRVAAVEAPASTVTSDPSVMQLADGSSARLAPGAEVEVTLQTATAVELRQRLGRVRYDVVHDPERRLTVDAAGVIVRVIGTAFTVDVANARVAVEVQSGEVEVDDGERVSHVAAGHGLTVPIPHTAEQPEPEDKAGVDAPRPSARVSVDALLEEADAARKARDWDAAAKLLRRVVAARPGKLQSSSALFTLGRVERSRLRHARAATAFRSCRESSPDGPLAEDALAEEATSWADAGAHERARQAAAAYLERHASGTHARRMRAILASSS